MKTETLIMPDSGDMQIRVTFTAGEFLNLNESLNSHIARGIQEELVNFANKRVAALLEYLQSAPKPEQSHNAEGNEIKQ